MIDAHRRPYGFLFTVLMAIVVFSPGHVRADGPVGRYTPSNGTVFDNKTKLLWQQTISGTSYTWSDAKTYCAGLSLNGTGWRLPSVKELQTIVDETKTNPAIDVNFFLGTPNSGFWTSSSWAADSSYAWVVVFSYGYAGLVGVASANRVRCVR